MLTGNTPGKAPPDLVVSVFLSELICCRGVLLRKKPSSGGSGDGDFGGFRKVAECRGKVPPCIMTHALVRDFLFLKISLGFNFDLNVDPFAVAWGSLVLTLLARGVWSLGRNLPCSSLVHFFINLKHSLSLFAVLNKVGPSLSFEAF